MWSKPEHPPDGLGTSAKQRTCTSSSGLDLRGLCSWNRDTHPKGCLALVGDVLEPGHGPRQTLKKYLGLTGHELSPRNYFMGEVLLLPLFYKWGD